MIRTRSQRPEPFETAPSRCVVDHSDGRGCLTPAQHSLHSLAPDLLLPSTIFNFAHPFLKAKFSPLKMAFKIMFKVVLFKWQGPLSSS